MKTEKQKWVKSLVFGVVIVEFNNWPCFVE